MAFLVLSCGRSFEEVGRMTPLQARLLREEYAHQSPAWWLADFAARMLGNKRGIIPERGGRRREVGPVGAGGFVSEALRREMARAGLVVTQAPDAARRDHAD